MKWTDLTTLKTRLDALRPLKSELLRNLEDWLRVELTYTSNAIEGNTLTRRETALVVEKGLTIGGKALREHLEAANLAHAIDRVMELAEKRSPIGESQVLELHAMILHGIQDDQAGRYRSVPVRISGSPVILPNPRKVPDLMADFGKWLSLGPQGHPCEFASEAHYRLVSIHPFSDGNGRSARLLANLLLLRHGYTPALIRPRDRLAYLGALEGAQMGGSKDAYEQLMMRAIERTLKLYLDAAEGKAPRRDREAAKPSQLRIGTLAKRSQESQATLRHWMGLGLLPAAGTTEKGYTIFDESALKRIEAIRSLQRQRLSLAEIKIRLKIGEA